MKYEVLFFGIWKTVGEFKNDRNKCDDWYQTLYKVIAKKLENNAIKCYMFPMN